MGAAFIILFASPHTSVGRVLSSKIFVGIGLISYSAYLWHQPLFAFAKHKSLNDPSKLLLTSLAAASIILAYFSWKYIETPFRDKTRFSRQKIFLLSAAMSLFFITFGLAGHFSNGFPNRIDPAAIALALGEENINPRRAKCHFGANKKTLLPQDSCILGDSKKIIGALIGDSHADAISFPLEQSLEKENLGFRSLTYRGCPPVQGFYEVDKNLECKKFNTQTFNYIMQNPNIDYIVMVARWVFYLEKDQFNNEEGGIEPYTDIFVNPAKHRSHDDHEKKQLIKKHYKNMIEPYLASDKKIILIYPVPEVGWDVPSHAAKLKLAGAEYNPNFTTSHAVFKKRNKETIEALDSIGEHKNLIRIKPEEIFCNSFVKDRCVAVLKDAPLYYDNNHLSNAGAKLVTDEIIKHIAY